jgi:hypothetical protein
LTSKCVDDSPILAPPPPKKKDYTFNRDMNRGISYVATVIVGTQSLMLLRAGSGNELTSRHQQFIG